MKTRFHAYANENINNAPVGWLSSTNITFCFVYLHCDTETSQPALWCGLVLLPHLLPFQHPLNRLMWTKCGQIVVLNVKTAKTAPNHNDQERFS